MTHERLDYIIELAKTIQALPPDEFAALNSELTTNSAGADTDVANPDDEVTGAATATPADSKPSSDTGTPNNVAPPASQEQTQTNNTGVDTQAQDDGGQIDELKKIINALSAKIDTLVQQQVQYQDQLDKQKQAFGLNGQGLFNNNKKINKSNFFN